jgi:monoamine oxidase
VKRRAAVKQLGFGLSASLILPSFLTACADKNIGPEVPFDGVVGIIGAGAAGLFAADILRSKGIKVRVFEAGNRIGGRIYSLRSFDPAFETFSKPDFPLELGAERILGSDGLWAKEIKLLGVSTLNFQESSLRKFVIDGALKTEADALSDSDFVAAQNFVATLSNLTASSVQEAIATAGISPRMYAILNSLIGNNFGADNPTLGATGLAQALTMRERNNEELVLRYNSMQDILISRFASTIELVELNSQVSKIEYSGEVINLSVRNLTDPLAVVEENAVVNILKDSNIEFSPGLPSSKLSALSNLGFGNSIRVLMDFRQNIWGNDTSFVLGATDGPIYFNAGVGRSEFNKVLCVTINGAKANEFSALSEDDLGLKLVEELDTFLGGNATKNIKNYKVQDWGKEQFIKGGYSYPLVGSGEADRAALAEPIGQTIFFAGEATDVKGDWGTINGALNSAERAALEVIDSIINPQ